MPDSRATTKLRRRRLFLFASEKCEVCLKHNPLLFGLKVLNNGVTVRMG